MSRHNARIHAFHLVFQIPFHAEWDGKMLEGATVQYLETLPDLFGEIKGLALSKEDQAFVAEETGGAFSRLPEIDGIITEKLKDWELDRIAKVDLALLRLAVYEIHFSPTVPAATAINQAVELAKLYGTDESPAFVNGILGRIAGKLNGN